MEIIKAVNSSRIQVPVNPSLIFASNATPENTNKGGELSTVDLLIKLACFVSTVNDIFSINVADLAS
jgi:hypothetical protein